MTIEILLRRLDSIPPTTAINRARRAAIITQINRMMEGGR